MADLTEDQILANAATVLRTASSEHQGSDLIAELLRQHLVAMDMITSLREIVVDVQNLLVRVEAQLAAERASNRKLRLELRQLASRWSRYPEDGLLFDAWSAAERQLSSILDADL